jgi:hypothetical protein
MSQRHFVLAQCVIGVTRQHGRFSHLPVSLGELWIHNLQVGSATAALQLVRYEHDVSVDVMSREGDL